MEPKLNYSLKKHNSWHLPSIGKEVYIPESFDQISSIITQNKCFGLWLGLGSNILLPDVISEPVILLQKHINQIEVNAGHIYAQAGVTCAKMAKKCIAEGFEDSIFFGGIPGTIGGALNMNAGAFGFETWEYVTYVDVIDLYGKIHRLTPDQFSISYRCTTSPFPLRFIGAGFKFNKGSPIQAQNKLKSLIQKRNETQPIGTFNCGSVFKNPYPKHAAQLIEHCELKGYTFDGAQVSQKHANFIINLGNATYQSIMHIINYVQEKVYEKTSIKLENEVIIL